MKIVNIFNKFREIYLFCRNDKGELEITTTNGFFPYFYEPDPEGNCKAYTGESLRKIMVSNPHDIPKQRTGKSYEADILFTKRYLIDKVKELTKCPIKYAFIDIEVLADELPNVTEAKYTVSCIGVYNSSDKSIQQFFLPDYQSEYEMIDAFIEYMRKEKFDLWLSWNVDFDYNYLYNRVPDFARKTSIINEGRYGKEDIMYPAGISILDYLQWFKKVTLGRKKSYALDYIAQVELGEESYGKIEFGKMSEDIKDKNKHDIERMVALEEKYKLIDYYDEVRRLAKVEWEDLIWNSRTIDGLLLQEAKNQNVALPMKPRDNEKEDYLGAYREAIETGAFWGVGKYDLTSAYPYAIIDFCLDPANAYKEENKYVPCIKVGDTYFEQNSGALLPTVVRKLIELKNKIKTELRKHPLESVEYKDTKTKYDAIKSIVNSAYGVMGNRFFRLYDKRVASATTFVVRSLLKYVQAKTEEKGYKVIYVDTDSVFIQSKEDLTIQLNNLIKEWARETFNTVVNIEFEYEGIFDKLLILTKCRYKGYLNRGKKGIEPETKGIEAKRKDSTEFMKKFQTEFIDKILNKESKDEVLSWIRLQIEKIKETTVADIAFPCKLGRKPEDYKNVPIFVRALNYTKEINPEFTKKVGSPFYYIYMKPIGERDIKTVIKVTGTEDTDYEDIILDDNLTRAEGIEYARKEFDEPELDKKRIKVLHQKSKPKDILAFDEENYKHINKDQIDWQQMTNRNIYMKLETIFEAMKWDISEFIKPIIKRRDKNV